LLSQLA